MKESYDKLFAQAEKEGRLKNVTAEIINWESPGQMIQGKITEIKPFEESSFDEKCNKYIMETDTGAVSFVLGSIRDEAMLNAEVMGKCVRVTFQGQKKGKKKRTYNVFTILIVEDPPVTLPYDKLDVTCYDTKVNPDAPK